MAAASTNGSYHPFHTPAVGRPHLLLKPEVAAFVVASGAPGNQSRREAGASDQYQPFKWANKGLDLKPVEYLVMLKEE